MSLVLLVDDSPHAQRMGQQLLIEEGCEVVTLTDGFTALLRLDDVDPDLALIDVDAPRKNGYEICEYVKQHPRHRHMRVLLLAGMLDAVDEARATAVGADGVMRKPFEASQFGPMIRPLLESAIADRVKRVTTARVSGANLVEAATSQIATQLPASNTLEAERIRAAVTVALDAAMPQIVDEITKRVLLALGL